MENTIFSQLNNRLQRASRWLALGLALVLIAITLVQTAAAVSPPNIISYQGRILNSNGVPVAVATADMQFRLYNSLSGGTCLWSNNDSACASTADISVSLTDGLFSENLGDTGAGYAAIPDTVFNNNATVYLEVDIESETLGPRKRLVAAPYALNAESLDGLDSTDFLQNTGGSAVGDYDFTNAEFLGTSPLVFEGNSNDGNTTAFAFIDPTGSNTITFPNASGTVALTSALAGYLLAANNLSDVASTDLARANLGLGNVENIALSTWAGSANITTLGTITSGTWNGSTIDISDYTNLTGDSEIVLTDDTLSIAASIARDTELHNAVTMSGIYDYITLSGQDIVRGQIDLSTDVTGTLPAGNIADAYLSNTGDTATGDYDFTSAEFLGASPLVFEGATNNGNITTFNITDPTGANTITFQDASGTVALTSDLPAAQDLDSVYDADADQTLDVDHLNGLTFDLVATGDLIIADAGTPFATFDDSGNVTFVNDFTVDTDTFFVDASTNRLGSGTTAPGLTVDIRRDEAAYLGLTTYDTTDNSIFLGRRARGSQATPAAVATGDVLASYQGRGYTGTGFSNINAKIDLVANQTYNATNGGSRIEFHTVDDNTTTLDLRLVIDDAGFVGLNTSSPSAYLDIQAAGDAEFIRLSDSTNTDSIGIYTGNGTPNGFLTAQAGSIFLDQTGSIYVNTDDATAWTDLTTAGGADTFESVYSNDGDKTLTVGSSSGFTIDLTATGDFTISDNGTPYAIFDDSGNITFANTLNLNGNTIIGNASTDQITFTGEILGASPLVFEGNTNDNIYTTFNITDPTSANVITFPDASGTVALTSALAGYLLAANNLSDVASTDLARANLGLGNVENIALSTWAGSANITTLGTITSGTWNGSTIDISDYTNLTAGTGLSLSDDTLNVDDVYLSNTGDTATGDYDFTSAEFLGASPLVFEGATNNGNITTFNITDPTGANTITFQDASGTVALTSDLSGYANTALSNLAAVAINTSLLPATNDSIDLGSTTKRWSNLYVTGSSIHMGPSASAELVLGYTDATTDIVTFDSTAATADIAFNTNDLYLDTSASRVGVGTTAPAQKLHLLDGTLLVNEPANPALVGSYSATGSENVHVSGQYAYLADGSSGLRIIDISNPASPVLISTHNTGDTARGVFVAGRYAYVANYNSGLLIVDVSNPLSPSSVGSYNTSGTTRAVHVAGRYAYVADGASGLQVIDISNPASPSLVGTYNTADTAYNLYVLGRYAYVADGSSGLIIIDISNPASPSLAGSYNTSGAASGVYVSGQYAYVADGASGLHVINVSNPASPSLVGTYNTSGYALSVYVAGQYAYLADNNTGLNIINVSNPASPTLTGTYVTSDTAWGVYVSGKYAYVAANTAGLQIIDIKGADLNALFAGHTRTNNLNVLENADIFNSLSVGNGLNVGLGGILSNGSLSVDGQGYITGNLGLGVTDPDEQLEIAGRLHLGQTTAPATTDDKLYNVGGTLYWNGIDLTAGGGGTPAGADTYIQYNSSGSFGAESAFTYDDLTDTLSLNTTGAEMQIMGADGTYYGIFDVTTLGANRTYTFPNLSGTVAMTSQIPSVPSSAYYWELSAYGIYEDDYNVIVGTNGNETITNAGFNLNGNDLFVAGDAGVAGSIYTNSSFIAGSTLTLNDSGITDSTILNLTASAGDINLNSSTDGFILTGAGGPGDDFEFVSGATNRFRITHTGQQIWDVTNSGTNGTLVQINETFANGFGTPYGLYIPIIDSTTSTGGFDALRVTISGSGTGSGIKRLAYMYGNVTNGYFIIENDGDTMIGTNANDGRLTVRQDNAADIFNLYDGTTNVLSVLDGGDLVVDSNTLFVDASVNRVGIGTGSPDEALTVAGNLSFTGAATIYQENTGAGLTLGGGTGANAGRPWSIANVARASVSFSFPSNTDNSLAAIESVRIHDEGIMICGNDGGCIFPNWHLYLDSDSAYKPSTNTWSTSSDSRLKDVTGDFTDGLDVLTQINPITYRYNGHGGQPVGADGIGIIAQDVMDIIPYTIGTFEAKYNPEDEEMTSFYSFNAHALPFILINAIKELNIVTMQLNDTGTFYLADSTGTANDITEGYDSYGLTFRGSGWDGAAMEARDVEMTLVADVTDHDDYSLSIKNTAGTQVAMVTDEGDLAIAGKLYPSAQGALQSDKYIYYGGAGDNYMRTNATGWGTGSYDFAEMFPSTQTLKAGEIVVFDSQNLHVRRATSAYDTKLAGIVSTQPGFLAGANEEGTYPIALAGRVPTKVNLEGGNIEVGDPITSSSTTGTGMKATQPGLIVGYALEPYSGAAGQDNEIIVFVNSTYYAGDGTNPDAGTDNIASGTTSSNLTSLNMEGDIYMYGNDIREVGRIFGVGEKWSIEADGTFLTESVIKTVIESYQNEMIETTAVTSTDTVVTLTGSAELTDGRAVINFEDVKAEFNDITSTTAPVNVVVTPNGPVSLYVSEKDHNGFTVEQISGSDSGITFDWMVTAFRKDYEPVADEPAAEDPIVIDPPTDPDPTATDDTAVVDTATTDTTDPVVIDPPTDPEPTATDDIIVVDPPEEPLT